MADPTEQPEPAVTWLAQRSAALVAGFAPDLPGARYLLLTPTTELLLPDTAAQLDRSTPTGYMLIQAQNVRRVRAVLATVVTGDAVLVTHGDTPARDARVFYLPSDAPTAPGEWSEEHDTDTVRAWVSATTLPPSQQADPDPEARLRRRLETKLSRPELAWALPAPIDLPQDRRATSERPALHTLRGAFAPEFAANPRAYCERNRAAVRERCAGLAELSRAEGDASESAMAVAVAGMIPGVLAMLPGPAIQQQAFMVVALCATATAAIAAARGHQGRAATARAGFSQLASMLGGRSEPVFLPSRSYQPTMSRSHRNGAARSVSRAG